ncbi:helix-turn-helix transcriptional regulator [Companilactobacillus zhachilii]|jgi:putative transcriptional regulator|uniref:helix-turn-helix transcriptional regulator n=1 Tax=Companilactobacillus zhachilii TaxID=2304606 RepID=UPI0019237210|nr:helix-turn-helix transcriptional regulator [Companilactobacillus zhachilii]MBL3531019.1 helix-turn-helix transcriptional regulator [Companilactobacillus zhachilii]
MILSKLQKLRTNNNLSYKDVADQLDMSKEGYWMIENGKRKLNYETAVRIASVFGLKPDDIFLQSELTKEELH